MSVATPKQPAKEPIQLDILIVCRKGERVVDSVSPDDAIFAQTHDKITRLTGQGFKLSKNDKKIILYGEMLKWNFYTDEKQLLDLEKKLNFSGILAA